MFATVRAARICDFTASFPYWRFFFPWLDRLVELWIRRVLLGTKDKAETGNGEAKGKGKTHSLTMINGRPCSSFITEARKGIHVRLFSRSPTSSEGPFGYVYREKLI